jgi:hypothetical protein
MKWAENYSNWEQKTRDVLGIYWQIVGIFHMTDPHGNW